MAIASAMLAGRALWSCREQDDWRCARSAERDTHFGFRHGAARRQAGAGRRRLPHVARRYDLMNDLMSGGLHRAWKDALVDRRQSAAQRARRSRCSTSPAAPATSRSGWSRRAAPARAPPCADINADMLAVGRERAAERGLDDARRLRRRQCRGAAVPGPHASMPCTIAFGIRNVPRIEAALARSPPRAAARRPLPLPGILHRRRARARRALRPLFVQRHPGARPRGRRRCRGLSLSGRIDPPVSASRRRSPT